MATNRLKCDRCYILRYDVIVWVDFLVPIHIVSISNRRTFFLSVKTLQSLVLVTIAISKMHQMLQYHLFSAVQMSSFH